MLLLLRVAAVACGASRLSSEELQREMCLLALTLHGFCRMVLLVLGIRAARSTRGRCPIKECYCAAFHSSSSSCPAGP